MGGEGREGRRGRWEREGGGRRGGDRVLAAHVLPIRDLVSGSTSGTLVKSKRSSLEEDEGGGSRVVG